MVYILTLSVNYLLLESMDLYDEFWGKQGKLDTSFAECVASRIISIFKKNKQGARPVHGKNKYVLTMKQGR